jgi:excisionase family DNA binding protein
VTERLLTARELAELLGFSASTIQDWSEAGKLPGFRVGGRRPSRILARRYLGEGLPGPPSGDRWLSSPLAACAGRSFFPTCGG